MLLTDTKLARCSRLVLIERKLIHKVPRQPVRAVIPRTGAVSATIERILRAGKFRRRSSKDIGHIVYELAPCVMQAGTEITTQALCQTCLKSVVGRAGRICGQADYSQVGIHASGACRERKARISIDGLQQSGSSRSYVPNLHYEILR